MNKTALLIAATLACASAQASDWEGMVVPYYWRIAVEGEAQVNGESLEFERDNDAISGNSENGFSLIADAQNGRFVMFAQVDYLNGRHSAERMTLSGPVDAEIETSVTQTSLAAGYQFKASAGKTYDLMLGLQRLSLDADLSGDNVSASRSYSANDWELVFRPYVPLSDNWAFNPTMSYGGGDSKRIYSMQPQFQYKISGNIIGRIGYRRSHTEFEDDNNNTLDLNFDGLLLGLGGTF